MYWKLDNATRPTSRRSRTIGVRAVANELLRSHARQAGYLVYRRNAARLRVVGVQSCRDQNNPHRDERQPALRLNLSTDFSLPNKANAIRAHPLRASAGDERIRASQIRVGTPVRERILNLNYRFVF